MGYFLARAVLAAVVTAMSVGYANAQQQFQALLAGLNEVPPVNSQGQGSVKLSLSGGTLSFTLNFTNLSANAVAAHIHFGRSRENGGVIVFFCGGGGKPACPASTSGSISGTITAVDVIGPAAQGIAVGDFAPLVTALVSQASYANIHTVNFPAGEIRGDIIQCPPNGCPF